MKILCLVFLLLVSNALACINTTYSRTDEAQITDELAYIILGEFAHHGDAFYEKELKRTTPLVEVDKPKFDDLNDHGAALLKLARYEESEKAFLRNETLYPNRYKTHSNLAVLYKKMGRYKDAEASLIKALEIQPEGHMGLGDYYLRMIQFLGKEDKSDGLNFLGHPYSMKPEDLVKQANVNKEHLITLIINDMSFADAYLILGDVLMADGNEQMALRAYYRGIKLLDTKSSGNIKDEELWEDVVSVIFTEKIKTYLEAKRGTEEEGYVTMTYWALSRDLNSEIHLGEYWLEDFKETEARLIETSNKPSFDEIENEMKVEHQTLQPVGYFKGELVDRLKYRWVENLIIYIFLFALIGLPIYIILKLLTGGFSNKDEVENS